MRQVYKVHSVLQRHSVCSCICSLHSTCTVGLQVDGAVYLQACDSDVRDRLLLDRIVLLQSQAAQVSEAEQAAQEQAFR